MRKGREVIETKTEDLLVSLEPKEVDAKARKLAEKLTELERYNDETRKIADERGTRKKALEAEAKKIREAVNEKAELRPVVVEVFADFKKATIQEIRQDTGEVVRERAMEPSERQPNLVPIEGLKNESPMSVAKRLFSNGSRAEDTGVEKIVEAAAKEAGVEIAAVLDALVDLGEKAAEKKAKKGGDDEETPE